MCLPGASRTCGWHHSVHQLADDYVRRTPWPSPSTAVRPGAPRKALHDERRHEARRNTNIEERRAHLTARSRPTSVNSLSINLLKGDPSDTILSSVSPVSQVRDCVGPSGWASELSCLQAIQAGQVGRIVKVSGVSKERIVLQLLHVVLNDDVEVAIRQVSTILIQRDTASQVMTVPARLDPVVATLTEHVEILETNT